MQVKTPITEARPLAWTTPDGRYTIVVTRTVEAYAVSVENAAGFRIDELARTFGDESAARDLARLLATMLRDGASVDEVVAAIQPAADVISAATHLLELAGDVAALSGAQRAAIAGAVDGRIVRGNGVRVDTLEALEHLHLGTRTKVGYRTTGLTLNARGLAMRDHILTHRTTVNAA